jgi:hypothetical protein
MADVMSRASSRCAVLLALALALPLALGLAGAGCAAKAQVVSPAPAPTGEVVLVDAPAAEEPKGHGPASLPDQGPPIESWATTHTDAAQALRAWVHENPDAARNIFSFDTKRPARTKALVLWAVHHPSDDVMVFAGMHPGWEWFGATMSKYRAGADQFLAWARAHPQAAEELMGHPGGLRWVGDHLYAAEWHP